MEPCSQENTIKEIKSDALIAKDKLHEMEVRQVEIQGDVKHIKTRLDNGMSHTIAEMHSWLSELKPKIEHHADIVRRVEDFGWWISKTVGMILVTVLVGIAIWAVANGWKPNVGM
jgi:hypothetical protein